MGDLRAAAQRRLVQELQRELAKAKPLGALPARTTSGDRRVLRRQTPSPRSSDDAQSCGVEYRNACAD